MVQRFSEDIDLNLNCENRPTEGQRKKLKNNIVKTVDELIFALTNAEDVRSRRDYNKYIIDFPSIFDSLNLKQYSLEPFELQVQDLRRTFIDKLFALGDYYLDGKIIENSKAIMRLSHLSFCSKKYPMKQLSKL